MLLSQWRSNGRYDYGIGTRCKRQGSCIGVNYANHQIIQSQISLPYLNDFLRRPGPIYLRVSYVFGFFGRNADLTDFYDFWHRQ